VERREGNVILEERPYPQRKNILSREAEKLEKNF
jgi:hypothetical protein